MTAENIERMITLSSEKKDLLKEILNLTKMQNAYIKDDEMVNVNSTLIKKEELMGKIDILDKEFLILYKAVKDKEGIESIQTIDINKYSNLKSLKTVVNEISKILNEITAIDKDNTEMMKASIDKVKSDIKQVKKGQKAYKGYNYDMGGSILIDEKK